MVLKTRGEDSTSGLSAQGKDPSSPRPSSPSLSPAQDPHPCPSPDRPIPPPRERGTRLGVLAVLPLLPVRGWRGSGEEGRGDEGLGRGRSEASKSARPGAPR